MVFLEGYVLLIMTKMTDDDRWEKEEEMKKVRRKVPRNKIRIK